MFRQHLNQAFLLWLAGLTICFAAISLVPNTAQAVRVAAVKGKKVLVDTEGDEVKTGDVFLVKDSSGKSRGIIKIRKIYPGKGQAIAILGKGTAKKGNSLKKRQKKSKRKYGKQKRRSKRTRSQRSQSSGDSYWGFMGGFSLDTMDVTIDVSGTPTASSMTGNGFSLKGLFDYKLFDSLWFRGQAGVDAFNASSDDEFCGTSNTDACEVAITYLTADLWGRFLITDSAMKLWIGAGFDLLFPLAKDATAVQDSSITNTSVPVFGAGIDWKLSGGAYIPIQFEYGLFPDSEDVSANFMAVRAGMAWPF